MGDLARQPLNIDRRANRGRARQGDRIQIENRRSKAVQMRAAGVETLAIAMRLMADPAVNVLGEATPSGYGAKNYEAGLPPPSHDSLRAAVVNDVRTVHNRVVKSGELADETLFWLEMERLDRVASFMWAKATAGSERHAGRIIEVTAQRSKMMGWDKSPVTVTHTGSIGVTIEGPQPVVDTEYARKMFLAMQESALEPPEVLEAMGNALPELTEATINPDTVILDVVESEPVET